MMRRTFVAMLLFVAFLASGCTASDRDYVRNHIVLLQPQTPSHSPAPIPVESEARTY